MLHEFQKFAFHESIVIVLHFDGIRSVWVAHYDKHVSSNYFDTIHYYQKAHTEAVYISISWAAVTPVGS